jgi:hypothetical protein
MGKPCLKKRHGNTFQTWHTNSSGANRFNRHNRTTVIRRATVGTSNRCSTHREAVSFNADGHGIVPDGFDLKIAVDTQFPCTVLLCHD